MQAGWTSLIVTVAVLAAVVLLARSLVRARPRLRALRQQQEWQASREADREAARRVLAVPMAEWPLLERLPEGVPPHPAYYATRCTVLEERPEGGFASRGQGWLVVGRDSLFFHPDPDGPRPGEPGADEPRRRGDRRGERAGAPGGTQGGPNPAGRAGASGEASPGGAAGPEPLAIPYSAIERVDSPYVNVLEVIAQDPVTRAWTSHFFRMNRPLVVAAYLSRLARFELILS
ncbi:hypothetical protein Tmar_0348 [Thermaerobacter marianensis DSM 12885]|uniref:Uncharacterized protein n=1 Tax=Thermaerobacter marianensis (strain ATCC 700841 / DSM 12885 / JCM 10246 / 7p75a) TaxID=644966 RepID=E6SG54_THEM7|nr:hypothetical protein [Thermaerobacter marianensis]ADU50471.1 hypothetical protein Tmar_0348 [Thermaerobacter marianensis DSM 12885]